MPKRSSEGGRTLYFIVRSWLMSNISAVILLAIVWVLKSINFVQTVIIGVFIFIASLAISKLFEKYIDKATKRILNSLDKHPKIKKFILKYF